MRKQKKSSAFNFDRYDSGRLHRAIAKAKDIRIYIRLKAMLLVAQGEPVGKVAKLFDKSSQVVYYWLTTYLKHHQPAALMDAFRSGRPPVAAAITDKHLLAALKRRVHCILPDAASQCPELNAMDHLFKALKANISANHQYKTIDQHAPYAQDYILKLSHQQARTTAAILSKNFWIRKLL